MTSEPTAVPASVPTHWYNLNADFPEPVPPALHPGTKEPLGPDDLAPLFPMALIMQEVSTERYIEIPEAVREVYAKWRPSPLIRADRLERADRDEGPHLLQVRGRQPRRVAQAEHRGAPGLLQQARGRHPTHHGNRCRASGAHRCRSRARCST